jgi:hypothetical protein
LDPIFPAIRAGELPLNRQAESGETIGILVLELR